MTRQAPKTWRFPWHRYGWGLVLILLFSFAPALSFLFSLACTYAFGCTGKLGTPCMIWGIDQADALWAMAVTVLLSIYTIPIGVILLFILAIWLAVARANWIKRFGSDA